MDLTYYETAVGPCIQCGKESEGSNYWLCMKPAMWDVVREVIEPLYPVSPYSGVRLVTAGRWFFPGMDKPFCGPQCGLDYKEEGDEAA